MVKRKTTQEDKSYRNSGATKIAAGTGVGFLGIRSGLPRALGVRLETHSTTKKQAKEVLKSGYLDPTKSGKSAIQLLEDVDPTKHREALGKVYITGVHPSKSKEAKLVGLLSRPFQRWGYRAQAGNEKKIKELYRKYGIFGAQQRITEAIPEHELYGAAVGLKGRTMYVGGSDDYFAQNFKPDFDDPNAMYSDKKVRVHGNRFSATVDAIRREGIKKLLKGDKRRIGAGLAILGGSGLAAGALINSGVKDIKSYQRKDGTIVKSYQRKKNKRR